jgi:Nucleotidyltransferase domain.
MRTAESATLDAGLDQLQTVFQEYPIRLAILFGSHATETTHPTSDIDFAFAFDECRPSDPNYNDTFLGLSADLSDALETDDVDLVDLHTASPALCRAIFESGILIMGTPEYATECRRQMTARESDRKSPRDRLDAALDRIDDHLDDDGSELSAVDDTTHHR